LSFGQENLMFHLKLIELESELLAKEQSERGLSEFTSDCLFLLEFIQNEVGLALGNKVAKNWRGWLTYRRKDHSLIVCRGRAFHEGGIFGKWRAGLDVAYGLDTASEYLRGFDVSPPQDLDHLLINFGEGQHTRVFLWYGENIAAYKLIFEEEVSASPHEELKEAVAEACVWILTRPKEKTLSDFLREKVTRNK
jgi:hypothetical protein